MKISSFEQLPRRLAEFKTFETNNRKSCAAYLQAIHELGKYIPIAELIAMSQIAIIRNEAISDKLKEIVSDLVDILLININDNGGKRCVE